MMGSRSDTAGLEASFSSPNNSVDNDTSVPSSANLDTQPSMWTSASTSVTASPTDSRDNSPTRPTKPPARVNRATTSPTLSRKNSTQDPSPPRKRSSIPTSITPRQLSASGIPSLPPPTSADYLPRPPVPPKPSSAVLEAAKESPRWPISPRLKSPPPSAPSFTRPTVASTARRNDLEAPAINVQRATPAPSPHVEPTPMPAPEPEVEEYHLPSGMRTPARGPSSGSSTLETVQEVSQPNTPRAGLDASIEKLDENAGSDSGARNGNYDTTASSVKSSQTATNSESGSDSGSANNNAKRSSSKALPLLRSRQSSSAIKFNGRGQTSGESSSRNMTVETEEVKDMPQLSLIPNTGGQRVNGSLRTRASNETIKPRKDKKKNTRKTTSVASGNASSKADIFEAKVASAVEEANSSDSDEKFVYDSNPPDAERPRRYHSRTPSVASMASQVDRNGMRSIHTVLENGTHNVHVKKNMKFVNTYTNNGNEPLHGDDDARGAGRSNVGSARGPARYHHHPHGRWGRNNNSHASLFDNESPFPNAARSGFSGHKSRPPSNPPSPQSTNFNRGWLSGDKRQMTLTNGYNMDDTAPVVEDERTPLLRDGTGRTAWSNRNRRHVPPRNLESQTYRRNPSLLNRFASCLVLIVMLLLVVTGAIGFMFATSQPLTDVALLKIGNVLASEQELMFDLTVQAHNPNVVVVMIDSADIEVFAKSPHAGNDSQWWRHPQGDDFKILDDPKNDPPNLEEPADGDASPNMRLGNIHTFDSPLTYEGSFFHREYTTSSGELRLARPGNSTDSGTARWERIISDDFTLVIKGVLKYTLPLSHKVRKVSISGKTLVKPNAANDPSLRPTEPETTISIKKATAWTA